MTRDEIIRIAVQCHLVTTANRDGVYMDALERFAALVVQAERDASMRAFERLAVTIAETEREACATTCESHYDTAQAARAIRARGEK